MESQASGRGSTDWRWGRGLDPGSLAAESRLLIIYVGSRLKKKKNCNMFESVETTKLEIRVRGCGKWDKSPHHLHVLILGSCECLPYLAKDTLQL